MIDAATIALGADLDVSSPGGLRFTSSGGIALVAGLALVYQRLYRMLVTSPGGVLGLPDYGIGAGQFIGVPLTQQTQARLSSRITAQFPTDPAVDSVASVTIAQPSSTVLQIAVAVVLSGTTVPLTFAVGAPLAPALPQATTGLVYDTGEIWDGGYVYTP